MLVWVFYHVAFILCVFPPLENLAFVFSIVARYLLDRCSITVRSIEVGFCSTASRSVEILLHALFFTCFASFFYLVIHSIFVHYIHAFIWIPCAPLIIVDHLYVSRVKPSSFVYPLSVMTKRGRNCGFFLRFYMLGGEIHTLVRGGYVSSCYGECLPPSSCTLVLWPCLHTLCLSLRYLYIYIYMMYVFFTYLYMCCFFFIFIHMFSLLYAIFYFCFTLRSRDEFCLKCFRNTGCQSLSCYGFSSCKVFQEFVLG